MYWTRRVSLLCLCLAFCSGVKLAKAQTYSDATGVVVFDDFSGSMMLSNDGGSYFLFNKMVGDGVGFDNGFSRLGLRAKLYDNGLDHAFGEVHTLITDDSRVGFNAGGGYRWLYDGGLIGLHGWYDNYESSNGYRYQQIAFGGEYLHPGFDARINGYIPIAQRQNLVGVADPGTELVFFGNTIGTMGQGFFERAYYGLDFEGGVPFPVVEWLRMYAGGYFLTYSDDELWGVRGRAEARVSEGVSLNFMVSNDEKFGTNVNLGVEVRFSGTMPTRFGQDYSALSRRYDQVRRNWPVQLAIDTDNLNVPLVNPRTGDDYLITWVDNRNTGGTGTFEDPLGMLPRTTGSDLILVRRGVGNTFGNVVLSDYQQILGEGKTHYIDTDRLGMVALPDEFATTGPRPTLEAGDPNQPVIRLANGNVVSSFNIIGGSGGAIVGGDVHDFLVECVTTDALDGLLIANASGHGIVRDSIFNAGAAGAGVMITNQGPDSLLLEMYDVTANNGQFGIFVDADGGDVDLVADDIAATGTTNAGLALGATGANLNADITDGNFSATPGDGVIIDVLNGSGQADFENLTADNNGVDGLNVVVNASTYNVNVIDSSLMGNADDNIDTDVVNGGVLNLFVDPTDASGAGDRNFEFNVEGGSTLNATFIATDLTGAGNDGVNGLVNSGSTASLVFDTSPVDGSGQDGLDVSVANSSSLSVSIVNGSFSMNGQNGIVLTTANDSTAVLMTDTTSITSNGSNGLRFFTYGGGTGPSAFTASLTDTDLSNNAASHIRGTATTDSIATVLLENVIADNAASAGGVVLQAESGATVGTSWVGGSISNTDSDGVVMTATGAGSQVFAGFDGVTIDGNAGDGIRASVTGGGAGSSVGVVLTDTTLRNNGGDGLDVNVDGVGAAGAVSFEGATVTGNTADGFQFDVSNGALFYASTTSGTNDFSNNGSNAFQGTVTGTGSIATVFINDALATDSGGSGGMFLSDDNGTLNFTYTNGSFSRSGGNGLESIARNSSTSNFVLDGVYSAGNVENGFFFDVNTDATTTVSMTGGSAVSSGNGENGLHFDVATGGQFALDATGMNFSGNGTAGAFSGVSGSVSGVGSVADVSFDDAIADNNTLHGFEFSVTGNGSLIAELNSTMAGPLSASNNAGSGVRFFADGANQAVLLMSGDNQFNDNGVGAGLDGVDVDISNTTTGVAQVSGTVMNSGANGIGILLDNVQAGAIQVSGVDSPIQNNVGHGVEIDVIDTTFADVTVDGTVVPMFDISGIIASNNGLDGINIFSNNSDLTGGQIDSVIAEQNGDNGVVVNLTNGSDWNLSITNNQINANAVNGLVVTADDNDTMSVITIDGNDMVSNADTNVVIDFSGSAVVELHVDNNTVDGDGRLGGFNVGTNFTGGSFSLLTSGEPPDTMGAVGTNHIVEMVNDGYSIYDKATGALLFSSSDEQFWTDAGVTLTGTDSFDPRIVFDPVSGRWFATAVTRGTGNDILVAVSNTDDPQDGWVGFQFIGELAGNLFSDFDMMAVDRDSLIITTNNFDATSSFTDISIFNIPLADLLSATPTIANLSRIENVPVTTTGFSPQPVMNLDNPADGEATLLSAEYFTFFPDGELIATNLTGTNSTQVALGPSSIVTGVPTFTFGPNGVQPTGFPVDGGGDRIHSSVVQVGTSIWATHSIQGPNGRAAIRWYEIDSNTNSVIQTGTIEDPNSDYIYPSIAVNPTGEVVIGFSLTSDTQSVSSAAIFGTTDDMGVTTFSTPTILQAGTGTYLGSRWGDYSATMVDPTDANTFWTFQEIAQGSTDYAIQISQITYDDRTTVVGNTADDGIRVLLSGNAVLQDSSIDNNEVVANGGDGIQVTVTDTATVAGLTIDGNSVMDNGGDGIRFETASPNTVGTLSISGNDEVSGNVGDGIEVVLNNVLALTPGTTPAVNVDSNVVTANEGRGISVDIVDSALASLSVSGNTVDSNLMGDGIGINLDNNTGSPDVTVDSNNVSNSVLGGISLTGVDTGFGDISVSANMVTDANGGDGILIDLMNNTGGSLSIGSISTDTNVVSTALDNGVEVNLLDYDVQSLSSSGSTVVTTGNNGYALTAVGSPIDTITFENNAFATAMGGDTLLIDLTDSAVMTMAITSNQLGNASDNGINIALDNSPIGEIIMTGNQIGQTQNMTGSGLDDSLPVIRTGFTGNTLAPNDDGSTASIALPFTIDFLGQTFNNVFVNNNGNVTFDQALSTFTPFDLLSTSRSIIAPFFADVDTRNNGMPVTYDTGMVAGQTAFVVNWIDVDYFASSAAHGTQLNTFQLVLVDRSDIAAGDFDIEFNYEQILWETGDASGGSGGLGGNSARVGFSNGVDFAFELPGSAVNGAFLDSGPMATSLIQNSINSVHDGRYVFFARNGGIGGNAPSGADGILLTATNGSDIGALTINGNTISGSGENGIELDITDSTLPGPGGTFTINNNEIVGQGGNGIQILDPDTNGSPIEMEISGNTITDNVAGNGILLSANDGAGAVTVTANGNTINNNAGMGMRIDLSESVAATLNIGDSAAAQNVLDMNTNAGIGINAIDNAAVNLTVENTSVTNTATDAAVTNFVGEGLQVRLIDGATLNNAVIGDATTANTVFSNNASHGVHLFLDGSAQMIDPTLQNLTINENVGDGINVTRQGSGVVDNVTITGSTIDANQGNGINLVARNALLDDEYDISENTITNNTLNGVTLDTEADARAVLDLSFNEITGNQLNGVFTQGRNNALGDQQSSTGTWVGNNISSNGEHGLLVISAMGLEDPVNSGMFTPLVIGQTGVDGMGRSLGNTISDNGFDGIQIGLNDETGTITGAGFVEIVNNTITGNGTAAGDNDGHGIDVNTPSPFTDVVIHDNTVTDNLRHGIELSARGELLGGSFPAVLLADLDNNTIRRNGGDGIEILSSGTNGDAPGGAFLDVTIANSVVTDNTGRGIDVLVRGDASIGSGELSIVDISNTTVSRNQMEGVYVVNTASQTQDQDAAATAALDATGDVNNNPILIFNFDQGAVMDNGVGSAFQSTGLVMRVGTSGAVNDYEDPSDFVSDGAGTLTGLGGVLSSITDSTFSGNFGSDVFFESFVSTVNPATTGGAWDDQNDGNPANDVYNPTGYQQDPLARLDLTFTGNSGLQASVTNLGALFNNAEAVFKSRTTGQNPGGPFTSATRRRNAQSLPDRGGAFAAPGTTIIGAGGNSDDFLYPGVGASTFRVSAGSDTSGFTNPLSDDFTDMVFPNAPIFGELPFTWGVF